MVNCSKSYAKVMLFAETNNILTEKISKHFHFVTICKDFGLKYNKNVIITFITKVNTEKK